MLFAGQLSDLQQVSASGGEVEMNAITEAMQSMQNIPIGYYLSMFIIYFLGGYFIYASLFAAIGSLAGDEEGDVQTFAFPVTMLILVSIFIMMAVVQQPHTPLAFWASIVITYCYACINSIWRSDMANCFINCIVIWRIYFHYLFGRSYLQNCHINVW